MICKLFLCKIYSLGIKNSSKMSNQNYYVPFGGIGEIEFNVQSKDRYKCNATHFNSDKTFPFFFIILIDLIGAGTKYYQNQRRLGLYKIYQQLLKDIMKTVTRLCNSFIKIKKINQ